jgi:hypothetical protein
MPREYISQPDCPFDVVIGWGNGENEVQIATVVDGVPSGVQRIVDLLNEYLAEADMPKIDYAELCNRARQSPHFDGWYVGLTDRRRVNGLIQLLRRARDSAFGKDA